MNIEKITPDSITKKKGSGEPIAALTAYDYPMTRFLDEAGVHIILVGDSLGMVVLGYPNTTYVTMEEMVHHVKAAARAKPKALLVADMPIGSYENPKQAVENARRLINAGAEAVKAEGGLNIIDQVKAIISNGIPFLGHIGMLPQNVLKEKGYHIKGKTNSERELLINDATALANAGAFAVVLELVEITLAKEITNIVQIPTIGIGSGPFTDGQILVSYDLLGLFPWFRPRFVKPAADCASIIKQAIQQWINQLPRPN